MNGLQKNLDVLRKEWNMVRADFKRNIARLKKPSLDPKDREHFVPHVLVAFISTFFSLRRTLTYITVIVLVGWGISALF